MTTATKQTDGQRINELQHLERYAHQNALELIDDFIANFERAVIDIRRYRASMLEAMELSRRKSKERTAATPVEVLKWTVSALRTPMANMRTDMACDISVTLAEVYRKRRELERENVL